MGTDWFGSYADPSFTDLELRAIQWLDGFYQLEHLLATRQWARRLRANATPALLFAALVHDAERYFAGGPPAAPDLPCDDPDYLFAHSVRSADIVDQFLRTQVELTDEAFIYQVRVLVLRHEIGGTVESDVLQAADSLSFLETLGWLTAEWTASGRYSVEHSMKKLRWCLERMRIPEAITAGLPFYEHAVWALQNISAETIKARRSIASNARLLLGSDCTPSITQE